MFCLIMGADMAYAGGPEDELPKELKKEYKRRLKDIKKGKWELFGSSRSLDYALFKHYQKIDKLGDDCDEVSGIATKFRSKNIGHQMAVNSACINYAQRAGSSLRGNVRNDMYSNNTNEDSEEVDRFYANYERNIEKEIRNEMTESYTLIRTAPDGTQEMVTYFIIDKGAAERSRQRAIDQAISDSGLNGDQAAALKASLQQ